MNPYERMHSARELSIELARRARDYQAELSDTRRRTEVAFYVGLIFGLVGGGFLAVLLITFANGS